MESFAEASEQTLPSMCGLHISESTVERITEDAGQRVRELRAEKHTQGPAETWEWQRDAEGQACGYVSLDLTGISQQGPKGAKAECKMMPVAMVYNPDSEHDDRKPRRRQVRYLSGYYELDEIGRQLRREAEAVGIMNAQRQIALSDGGAGLEDVLKKYFPNAICILDFYHAKEHLVELAKALHPQDETRQRWLDDWCHRLKHEGGVAILASLKALDLSSCSDAVREVHRKQVTYFTNHSHRMDYPTYVSRGWQIGSGPVESACKTVLGNRLKGGGMRWGQPGSDGVGELRGMYRSQPICWTTFWQTTAS
jgi:hypothetical protein